MKKIFNEVKLIILLQPCWFYNFFHNLHCYSFLNIVYIKHRQIHFEVNQIYNRLFELTIL